MSYHASAATDSTGVFDDPHHLIEDITKPEHGETRNKAVGIVANKLFTVIFTHLHRTRRQLPNHFSAEGKT